MELRLQYSMIVVRAINGLVDTSQQGVYADSVASIANRMDLPSWLVELRHDSTHNQLPSISVLQAASSQLLSWYVANYWRKQEERIILLRRFCEKCCHSSTFDNRGGFVAADSYGNSTMEMCREALIVLSGNSYSYIGNYKTLGSANVSHAKFIRDLNKMVGQQNIMSVSFLTDIFLPILLTSVANSGADMVEKYSFPAAPVNAFPFPLWVYVMGIAVASPVQASLPPPDDVSEPSEGTRGSAALSPHNHALICHRLWLFAVDSVDRTCKSILGAPNVGAAEALRGRLARTRAVVQFIIGQLSVACNGVPELPLREEWRVGVRESFALANGLLTEVQDRTPDANVLRAALGELEAMFAVILPTPKLAAAIGEVLCGKKRSLVELNDTEFESERAVLGKLIADNETSESVWKVQASYPLIPYGCRTVARDAAGDVHYDRNCLLDLVVLENHSVGSTGSM
mgnify:FL=1